jgi:hypothetical protein
MEIVTCMALLMTLPVSQADELKRIWKVSGHGLIIILSWSLSMQRVTMKY